MSATSLLLIAAVITAAIAAAPAATADPAIAVMPEGKYRALVLRTCSVCHSIETVVSTRRTLEQWDQLIGGMVDRGAQASDEQQAQILEYLVRNYGRSGPAPLAPPQ